MMTEVWSKREASPLTVYCHDGSYAFNNVEVVLERYSKAVTDVCAFLEVQREKLPPISIYLCEFLEADVDDIQLPNTTAHLDREMSTIWMVYTSESPGADPEIALTPLVLHHTQGQAVPERAGSGKMASQGIWPAGAARPIRPRRRTGFRSCGTRDNCGRWSLSLASTTSISRSSPPPSP